MRQVGLALGLPEEMVYRQPFPGPGLAIRIIGEVTPERLETLRAADWIVMDEIKKAKLYRDLWQAFAVLTDTRSVGVMGDFRTYGHVVALRAVTAEDAMTADWARLPYDLLGAHLEPHRQRGARREPRGVRHHVEAPGRRSSGSDAPPAATHPRGAGAELRGPVFLAGALALGALWLRVPNRASDPPSSKARGATRDAGQARPDDRPGTPLRRWGAGGGGGGLPGGLGGRGWAGPLGGAGAARYRTTGKPPTWGRLKGTNPSVRTGTQEGEPGRTGQRVASRGGRGDAGWRPAGGALPGEEAPNRAQSLGGEHGATAGVAEKSAECGSLTSERIRAGRRGLRRFGDAVMRIARERARGTGRRGAGTTRLALGLAGLLEAAGMAAFGPSRAAARIEASKSFAKDRCRRHGIR